MRAGAFGALLALALAVTPLHADPPGLEARLECERAVRPGRVVCELTSHARSGVLVWSDSLVVRAPDFARPLRSRVLGTLSAPGAAELVSSKLALVATRGGEGKLELLVRGVVCRARSAKDGCSAVAVPVSTVLRVAAPLEP